MTNSLTQEVETDLELVWLDVVLAAFILSVLAASYYLTQGMNRVISLSLLAGYSVFLIDFYGKDLLESVE